MTPKTRTVSDNVAAAGLCLLAIALVDGAIELFEFATAINLWATCGLIGGALLCVVHVVLGAFEKDSSLRRVIRRVSIWKRQRARKSVDVRPPVETPPEHMSLVEDMLSAEEDSINENDSIIKDDLTVEEPTLVASP